MDSGIYAAYSGLLARTQALDLAANNLANAGTTGYRAGRESFSGALAEAAGTLGSQVGGAVNDFGVLGGSSLSTSQGQIKPTGNPLDLAIQGPGFFALQTSNGTRYTRDGEFQVSRGGVLQTKDGSAVLNAVGQAISVPSGSVSISADGTISVATDAGSAIVGKVAVMDLGPNGTASAEGDTLYKAAAGTTPTVTANATIQQGAVEGSNEDAIHGTMQLILMQRQAEMMQRALTTFHNDFDKTATEEISRV
jgi:flagellar basal-body rod protein FlgF/flagellar basal-body rod protein FlgG